MLNDSSFQPLKSASLGHSSSFSSGDSALHGSQALVASSSVVYLNLSEYGDGVVILLMGVSGSGKTTVGQLLASQLGWEFADGDDYHSAANVEKMRSGIPL